MATSLPRLRTVLAGLVLPAAVLLPAASAHADPLLTAAVPSVENATPDCPVSAASPVCVWNVPVDPANVFTSADYGQCPYWAAEKYPSLVLAELTADPLGEDWDGGTWAEHASQEGLSVSATPASGDLAVWQARPDDPAGHVAYVETLDQGAVIVSQMDGDSSGAFPALQGTTEYISTADLAYFEQTYGLEFIQTGDPSTTPLSDVEIPTPDATSATTAAASTIPADAGHHRTRRQRRSRRHRTARARHLRVP